MALNPYEEIQYANQLDALREQFGLQLENNRFQYDNTVAQQRRGADQLSRKFNTPYSGLWQRLPASFAQRGLLNSGIYNQARTQMATAQQNAGADLHTQYAERLGGLNIERLGAETQLAGGTSRIEADRTAKRVAVASELRGSVL